MADSPTEVIVDPTKIDDTDSANWQVQVKAILKSGEMQLSEDNAVYWWYVKDGQYTRPVTTSDTWLVTTPNADGTFPAHLWWTLPVSKISSWNAVPPTRERQIRHRHLRPMLP